MVRSTFPRLAAAKIALLLFLFIWMGGLIFLLTNPASTYHKYRAAGCPFGFTSFGGGPILTQDFSYNVVVFRGIQQHLVPRPYRIEDQEKMLRQMLPRLSSGLSHAYSPVAFTLMLPLLPFSGGLIYLFYCLISALGILLLFYFYLLPRAIHPVQLIALAICAASVCLTLSFFEGQSSLITTSLLGALWFLLQRRESSTSWRFDFLLALLFWALCLKPSVTVIPLALLLGAKAWRPIALGSVLLALNWLLVAKFYGGWWTGFWDYLHLLSHYDNPDFTPFMRRGYVPGHEGEARLLFAFERVALGVLTLSLLVLCWTRRITLSELFRGMIGIFLLVSPYLLPSEDWILCLLVVEGSSFGAPFRPSSLIKLLLLAGIMDLRVALVVPWDYHFEFKCLLLGWMLAEAFWQRRETRTQLQPI